jgi:hypothetical protein
VAALQVPALQDAPAPAAPAAPSAQSDAAPRAVDEARTTEGSGGSGLKTAGIVTAGVGATGLVAGTVFGLVALSKNSAANSQHCGSGGGYSDANACDPTGITLRHDAVNAGNLSTIAFVTGGVVFATGAGMWLLAPSSHVQATPAVAAGGAGLVLRGNF